MNFCFLLTGNSWKEFRVTSFEFGIWLLDIGYLFSERVNFALYRFYRHQQVGAVVCYMTIEWHQLAGGDSFFLFLRRSFILITNYTFYARIACFFFFHFYAGVHRHRNHFVYKYVPFHVPVVAATKSGVQHSVLGRFVIHCNCISVYFCQSRAAEKHDQLRVFQFCAGTCFFQPCAQNHPEFCHHRFRNYFTH